MTEKELKRLSRSELLELLLIQTREAERLAQKLAEAEQMITDRQLKLEKAGDIAHAALEINGVMDAAQAAARQYLDNIARMEKDAEQRCEECLREARQTAEQILREAQQAAEQILQEAQQTAAAPEAEEEPAGEIQNPAQDEQ